MMILIKRSYKAIIGNPRKSISQWLLFFTVIFSISCILIFVLLEDSYIKILGSKYPTSAILVCTTKEETVIERNIIEKALENPNVAAYSYRGKSDGFIGNWMITIRTNSNYDYEEVFEEAAIQYGSLPNEFNQGAMIPSCLVEQMQTELLCEIDVAIGENLSERIPVIGVYTSDLMDIYVDIETFTKLGGHVEWNHPTVYFDNAFAVNDIIQELNQELPANSKYVFAESTDYNTSQFYKSIQISKTFISICYYLFLVIVLLFSLLMQIKRRDYYERDRRILCILGETHGRQHLQYYIQESLLFIPSSFLGIVLAKILTPAIQKTWIQIATRTFTEGSSIESFDAKKDFLKTVISPIPQNEFFIRIGIIIIVFASFLVASQIIWSMKRKKKAHT